MPRPLFNYLGVNVGSVPDDTPDDVYQKALAVHALPPPPEVFPDVTARQIRRALLKHGLDETMIVTALNTLPSPTKEEALIEWEYSNEFIRTHYLVPMVGQMLGWNSTQLDDLWRLAKSL
jgi:hypothetical protein